MNNHLPNLPEPVAESTHLSTEWIHEINLSEKLTDIALPSFNISESFADPSSDPHPEAEHSLLLSELIDLPLIHSHEKVTFEIIENATQKSNKLLVDCNGYSYTIKSQNSKSGRVVWRCTLRRNTITCTASVIQIGEVLLPGLILISILLNLD